MPRQHTGTAPSYAARRTRHALHMTLLVHAHCQHTPYTAAHYKLAAPPVTPTHGLTLWKAEHDHATTTSNHCWAAATHLACRLLPSPLGMVGF